jgi:hypothetical protein
MCPPHSIDPSLLHEPSLSQYESYLDADAPFALRRVTVDPIMLQRMSVEDYDKFVDWVSGNPNKPLDSPERSILMMQRNKVGNKSKKRTRAEVTHLHNRISELEEENFRLRAVVKRVISVRHRLAETMENVIRGELDWVARQAPPPLADEQAQKRRHLDE